MMKCTLPKEEILKSLQPLVSIADKKHTIPTLSCILFTVTEGVLTLKSSDVETEVVAKLDLQDAFKDGAIAIPAKKLFDIVRNLPNGMRVEIAQQDTNRVVIRCQRSKFILSCLDANTFPVMDEESTQSMFKISMLKLISAMKRVQFAMAKNDVRYFLNGMLWNVCGNQFRTVATDGHRMSTTQINIEDTFLESTQMIVPRKAIDEILRIFSSQDEDSVAEIQIGKNHFRLIIENYQFISKLIDGRYPDYTRVIPPNNNKVMKADRRELKEALQRTAILSNETYRGVRVVLDENMLNLSANNPEHEEAKDQVEVVYSEQKMEMGFNINYLLELVNAIESNDIEFKFDNPAMSLLVEDKESLSTFVLSPIKL